MDLTSVIVISVAVIAVVLILVACGLAALVLLLVWQRSRPRTGPAERRERSGPSRPPPAIAQMLGLHPTIAFTTVIVDVMLTALDLTGVGWGGSCLVAGGLGWACYLMQRGSYGDTHDAAFAKGIIVALLTAIPTPLPSALTLSSGAVGGVGLLLGCGKSDGAAAKPDSANATVDITGETE